MDNKYYKRLQVLCNGIHGVVVENFKLPGDVCVKWETGQECSYDAEWLDENASVENSHE